MKRLLAILALLATAAPAAEPGVLTPKQKARCAKLDANFARTGKLLKLYRALCAVRGTTPVHATPDAVSAAACNGNDAVATEALNLFCAFLGSAIGDMALFYGVQRIYLAGGFLPRFGSFIQNSCFVERFLNKGPMTKALQRIPVRLVEHGQLGVIGAASWYLQKPATQAFAA